MKSKYKNPWHHPESLDHNGPEYYETEVTPKKIGPYLVYERLKGICWDWVFKGVCITQRAGFDGTIPNDMEKRVLEYCQ